MEPLSATISAVTPVVPASIARTCRMGEVEGRPMDAAIGDDRGDQLVRRNIEGGVVHVYIGWCRGLRAERPQLRGLALLDVNVSAARGGRIDRARRGGDRSEEHT